MSDNYVWLPTYSTGSYGGLDERVKRRKRKQPLGFSKLETKKSPVRKKRG